MSKEKRDDPPLASRSGPETRKASLLLSALVLTPDSALETFRERRAADAAVDLKRLRRARDILDAVSAAIVAKDEGLWARIDAAWQVLDVDGPSPDGSSRAQIAGDEAGRDGAVEVERLKRVTLHAEDSTTLTVDNVLAVGRGLPFQQRDGAPPPAAGEEGAGSPVPGASAGSAAAPLPPHLAAMSVERYAALCAECAVHSRWIPEIQARYDVRSMAERAALNEHWRERIAADPSLAQAWQWHYARYTEWAKQQRG